MFTGLMLARGLGQCLFSVPVFSVCKCLRLCVACLNVECFSQADGGEMTMEENI